MAWYQCWRGTKTTHRINFHIAIQNVLAEGNFSVRRKIDAYLPNFFNVSWRFLWSVITSIPYLQINFAIFTKNQELSLNTYFSPSKSPTWPSEQLSFFWRPFGEKNICFFEFPCFFMILKRMIVLLWQLVYCKLKIKIFLLHNLYVS